MKTKTFDCIEMKRRGAARIFEATKGMSLEQEVAYWRRRAEALRGGKERIHGKPARKPGRRPGP